MTVAPFFYLLSLLSLLQRVGSASVPLDRTGWEATADSFHAGNEPAKAIDGNEGTFWHSEYAPDNPLPNTITIDMKGNYIVNGVSIQPRQDGSGNGRIGQHIIETSVDNSNWNRVAVGAYVNDATTKKTSFVARQARYVRVTAVTEAQGANNHSAAEVNLIDTIAPAYTAPNPSKGLWINTVDFPIVPAAAAVLPNGKILLWSAYKLDDFGGGNGFTQTAIYDPATGTSTQRTISNTQHDMFCPGISMDFNGRIIVTGGNNAEKTSIYNPDTDAWITAANMRIPRGYQSTTTTWDGKIFNIGGSWSGGNGGKNGEIYDVSANTWSLIQNALVSPMLTNDRGGVYRADNHAWLFAWKNGSVFQAGPSKAMNWYNTVGAGSTTGAGTRANDGDAMNGNAIMYDAPAGKILTAGGAANYQTDQARNNAYVITLNNPGQTPTVTQTAPMGFARGFANGVVLPDGTVFVTGGQSWVEPFSDATAVQTPELWVPSTGQWTQMNPMAIPRTYHSVALLLPDATVLNGGGGLCGNCGTNHWDGEIFVPPYLLNADGSRRARPGISQAPGSLKLGGTFSVTTDRAVTAFSLVRLGTATHTVNTDQRRVPLTFTKATTGNVYSVTLPGDAGVVLPGYWYLFAMDGSGTPSPAKIVKVLQ
ncbi:galactose oxidase [Westerdykella ornata]|uniref:Galactose oxidase n=1 Tax=Westerdykella ornata TaxID=318751 RepID=A0A6A6JDI4_WESOR|nr:galactose oxidase [Westerdykella ornata]KAF2274058.1 galactose oxidase [Westerdykella ornata]